MLTFQGRPCLQVEGRVLFFFFLYFWRLWGWQAKNKAGGRGGERLPITPPHSSSDISTEVIQELDEN